MIESLLKPLARFGGADFAMRLSVWRMRLLAAMPAGRYILRKLYAPAADKLEREVFGMRFSSPVGIAAGYDRDGAAIDALDAAGFGFVEVGSVTPRPQGGSPHPYLFRLAGDRALLNRAVIECAGVERVIGNLKRRSGSAVVGCNLAKNAATPADEAPADYLRSFRSLYQYADYFTVNLCDNTTSDIYVPGDRESIMAIVEPLFEFRRGQNRYCPILLKISPDLTDEQIDTAIDIMLETPVDGIVACGGTSGRYGLENSSAVMHSLGRTAGALCGRPLRERSLQIVDRAPHIRAFARRLSHHRLRRHIHSRRRAGDAGGGRDTGADMHRIHIRRRQVAARHTHGVERAFPQDRDAQGARGGA